MAIPSQQIGWSQRAKLLWFISKQLERLTQVMGNVNPIPSTGDWTVVTGGAAGDGTVLVDDLADDEFTIIGPNDNESNGWVYLTKYYASQTCIEIDYSWASFDEGSQYDWPVYWTSETKPTGEPDDLTTRVSTTPESGTWTITIPAGQWFSVGVYSDDSCCGRGFLSIGITTVACGNLLNLAFAAPEDSSSVACTNASNPSLLVPIYYTPGTITENVTLLYYDEALTTTVASGYYSDGTTYYAVNIYGLIQVIGSCV